MPSLFVVKKASNSLSSLTVEAHASIPHGQAHTLAIFPFGSDQQLPRPTCTPAIASEALRTRFRMTCWSWNGRR